MGKIIRRFKKDTLVYIKNEDAGVFKVTDYDEYDDSYQLQVMTPYIFSVTKESAYIGQLVYAKEEDVTPMLYKILKQL